MHVYVRGWRSPDFHCEGTVVGRKTAVTPLGKSIPLVLVRVLTGPQAGSLQELETHQIVEKVA